MQIDRTSGGVQMMRAAIIFGLIAAPACAQVQPCPDMTQSWSIPYSAGTHQFVSYYLDTNLLAAQTFAGSYNIYTNVPVTVAQLFQSQITADTVFNTRVKGVYSRALLAESGCPLLNENGNYLLAS
jgi:hypothetical protein